MSEFWEDKVFWTKPYVSLNGIKTIQISGSLHEREEEGEDRNHNFFPKAFQYN